MTCLGHRSKGHLYSRRTKSISHHSRNPLNDDYFANTSKQWPSLVFNVVRHGFRHHPQPWTQLGSRCGVQGARAPSARCGALSAAAAAATGPGAFFELVAAFVVKRNAFVAGLLGFLGMVVWWLDSLLAFCVFTVVWWFDGLMA